MSDLSCTTVTWRGVTLSGDESAAFGITSLAGWEGLPAGRRETPGRPAGHGRFSGPTWADERIVTLGGVCYSLEARDALLVELGGAMTWGSDGSPGEDLTVDHAGRVLTATAALTAYVPEMTSNWSVGHFPFAIEWRCADPLRYGALVSGTTTFPVQTGGLEYDLYTDGAGADLGYLDYGDIGSTGRVELANEGTADTWPQFVVDGPVDADGFEIVTVGTGARLVFVGAVPSGSQLVLDAATGQASIDGGADRGGLLTYRDWAPIPAGGSVEYAFIPRGSDLGATLTVSARPAFW